MAVTFRGRAAVGLAVSLGVVVLLFSGVLDSLGTTTRGLILVAAGVTLLGVVLPLQLRTRTLLNHGAQAQGTVVDVMRSRTYHPVVRFTTPDGRTLTFTSGLGFGIRQPEIGSAVPVRYHHDDPERAEIDRASIWMVPAAPPLLVGVGRLVAAVVAFTDEPQVAPAADESQVAPTVVDSPEASGIGEPVPIGRPAKVATGRIGDRLTVVDHSGRAQLEITVTRLKFSGGDQVLQPEHGWRMGVHVEAHALADQQHLIMAALVDGRYYDELVMGVSSTGLQPMPGVDELSLSRGERVAGWLELDVPARHGQLVLRDVTLQHKVAVWTY